MKQINELFKEYTDVVTTEQLQQMLQLGRSKTYSLLKNGEIKAKKIGSEYRIAKNEVIRFLEEI